MDGIVDELFTLVSSRSGKMTIENWEKNDNITI